jgi:hypothetical protein
LVNVHNIRIKEQLRNGTLVVSGDQWPIFLYQGYRYDEEDPWNGLFRSRLLVLASTSPASVIVLMTTLEQAFKHIFTSPSSVEKEPKATRSRNACIHGMTCATVPSMAYVATQVRKSTVRYYSLWKYLTTNEGPIRSLLHIRVFQDGHGDRFRTVLHFSDRAAGGPGRTRRSERIAHLVESVSSMNKRSIPCSQCDIDRQIFPSYSSARRVVAANSALARIKQRHALVKGRLGMIQGDVPENLVLAGRAAVQH